jgi:putative transposase
MMTEDEKMQVAVFRFSVIGDFVNGTQMSRAEKRRLMRDKCARKWQIPFSEKTRISMPTINRWVRLYKDSGRDLKSLLPKDRCDQGKSRAMDEDTCLSLIQLRQKMPDATVPLLIEQMNRQNKVTSGIVLNNATVYRFLHHNDLMHPPQKKPTDRRKFEAELPNDLWQSDVMHGPKVHVDGKRRKTYLIAVIDDHSRLICHGQFYLSEKLAVYLQALEQALLKRGLPRKLYVDNGPAFRSRHLEQVTASLGIALIHSKPYKPQGRGKIERFFRTVRGEFLYGFKGQTLDEINEAFDLYLHHIYHQRKHSATGKSPFQRFTDNMQCLRQAPTNLTDHFRQAARRRVGKDRTVTLNGKLYEAPVNLIGHQVELLFHADEPDCVEVRFKQKSYGTLIPVDVHINCRVKRDRNHNAQIDTHNTGSQYQGGKLLQ